MQLLPTSPPHLCPAYQLVGGEDLVPAVHHARGAAQEAHQGGAGVPALQVVVQADDHIVAACGRGEGGWAGT